MKDFDEEMINFINSNIREGFPKSAGFAVTGFVWGYRMGELFTFFLIL